MGLANLYFLIEGKRDCSSMITTKIRGQADFYTASEYRLEDSPIKSERHVASRFILRAGIAGAPSFLLGSLASDCSSMITTKIQWDSQIYTCSLSNNDIIYQ